MMQDEKIIKVGTEEVTVRTIMCGRDNSRRLPRRISDEKELIFESGKLLIELGKNPASVARIQREFAVSFNKAEEIMKKLIEMGVINNNDSREIVMDLEEYLNKYNKDNLGDTNGE